MVASSSSSPQASVSVNLYPGRCCLCGADVLAREGVLVRTPGERPSVVCRSHPTASAAAASRSAVAGGSLPVIEMEMSGSEVVVRPRGFLGGDLFARYRSAGVTYRAAQRASFAPVSEVAAISRRLVDAGFAVAASDEVRAAVAAEEDRQAAETVAAAARMDLVSARLRESGLSLMAFQAEGVAWLAPRAGAVLADEMGLGKTIQVLAALPEGGRAVVVCPKVAKGVWLREASRWRPDLSVATLRGRGSFRWPEPGEVVVLNYEILPGDAAREAVLASCPEGVTVVADEGHALKAGGGKNGSQRGKAFRAISDRVRELGGRSWVVTGSPLLNSPPEIWSLLTMVGQQSVVFGSYKRFVALMGGREGKYATEWTGAVDPGVPEMLRRAVLRREKAEVLPQMPAKVVDVLDVDVEAKSQRELDAIQAELREAGVDVDLIGASDDSWRGYYEDHGREGFRFEEFSRACEALARAKIPAALEVIEDLEERGEPVVVFSAYRASVDALAARDGWASITGDTSDEQRTELAARFQAGELRGLAGTIQAMGVAVTLTRSCHTLVIDPCWVPDLNRQAEDRTHRIGQTRTSYVTYLRARHPLDALIFRALDVKRALVAASVGAAAVAEGAAPRRDASGLAVTRLDVASVDGPPEDDALADLLAEIARAKASDDVSAIRRASRDRAGRAAASRGISVPDRTRETSSAAGCLDTPRPPRDAEEYWAAMAIAKLAACDPDGAQEANGVGFMKSDVALGHALAASLPVGLTDLEWAVAAAICRRYPRQVGRPD